MPTTHLCRQTTLAVETKNKTTTLSHHIVLKEISNRHCHGSSTILFPKFAINTPSYTLTPPCLPISLTHPNSGIGCTNSRMDPQSIELLQAYPIGYEHPKVIKHFSPPSTALQHTSGTALQYISPNIQSGGNISLS
jgi:hypothetical protein